MLQVHCTKISFSPQVQGIVLFFLLWRDKASAPTSPHQPQIAEIRAMPKSERTAAILVAAGRGLRAGSGGPKQYRSIGGQTVIFRAVEPFCRHPQGFAVP